MWSYFLLVFLALQVQSFKIIQYEGSTLPDKMFAGQIHYSRIPVEYWEHRIQMTKALGLNALSVYVMWNYHEIEKGKFDYQTGNRNLPLFLELAEKHEMKVLFRPGPFVCAEWDFGGFPGRLLNIHNLTLRANNQPYLDEVKIYFQSLVPIMKSHLQTTSNPNGSIILLQIENQYGFYGADQEYMAALRQMWHDLGIQCQEYYVDTVFNLLKSHWEGANIGINDGVEQVQYDYAKSFARKAFIFGGEIYSGWLTRWYEDWAGKSIDRNEREYGFLMDNNHSYSMYMVHGGSNFGLTAGANAFGGDSDYCGHITSYDYDAPINQQGSYGEKFLALRELISKHATWDIPDMPENYPTTAIPTFKLKPVSSMFTQMPSPISSSKYEFFESDALQMYNQGIVVYQTTLTTQQDYYTFIVHDYAHVYLNKNYLMTLNRCRKTVQTVEIQCEYQNCTLMVMVEAMGHINFDHQMETDRKGLFDFYGTKGGKYEWTMWKFPIDSSILKWKEDPTEQLDQYPVLMKATLNLSQPADTFLDMSHFGKGYVWVNGHNLGRYWTEAGPQKRLFCPGVWLKSINNEIFVLELNYDSETNYSITGEHTLK